MNAFFVTATIVLALLGTAACTSTADRARARCAEYGLTGDPYCVMRESQAIRADAATMAPKFVYTPLH